MLRFATCDPSLSAVGNYPRKSMYKYFSLVIAYMLLGYYNHKLDIRKEKNLHWLHNVFATPKAT